MNSDSDNAPPGGIKRPRLATKSVYQDDPKTSRPILSVHARQARPVTPVTGDNDPRGMKRPRLDTKPSPYDQDMDPDY